MSERKIRLFVDAHCFDKEYQGSRTFVKELYAILQYKSDIQLYLGAYNVEELKKSFTNTENIVFLKYRSNHKLLRLFFDIPRLIKKHKIDCAHFQYISPPLKNCKQIVTLHDLLFEEKPEDFPWLYRKLRKIFFKRSAAGADILTTVSDHSKKSIQKYFSIDANRVVVIRNGVSASFFQEYDQEHCKHFILSNYGIDKFILFVSRIEPRKNHLTLIKAWIDLRLYEKGYHLALLGHKSIECAGLEQVLREVSPEMKKFIFFNTAISDQELIFFYRAADVFVYPSKAEGFGIPPLEAAAARVPVICSNATAMNEYTFFSENHIDPCNLELLKERLHQLTSTPRNENELRKISAIVKKEYTWAKTAEEFYQLITAN